MRLKANISRNVSILRRKASKDARIALNREKRYAREFRKILASQMVEFGKTKKLSGDLSDVINGLYDKELPYWLTNEYKMLDTSTVKAKGDEFFLPGWSKWVKDFKKTKVAKRIVLVNDTTKEIVSFVIKDGADRGLEFAIISENILKKAKSIETYNRAMTIARTEMGNAINHAKERSSKDFEAETGRELGKLWIHRGSNEPRISHIEADTGIPIPKDVPFIVDGEQMMYPHDSGASAGNTINCNCQVVYTRLN